MDEMLRDHQGEPPNVGDAVEDGGESARVSAGDSIVTTGSYIEMKTLTAGWDADKVGENVPSVKIPAGWRVANVAPQTVELRRAPWARHYLHVTIQRRVEVDPQPADTQTEKAAADIEAARQLTESLKKNNPPQLDPPVPCIVPEHVRQTEPEIIPEPEEAPVPALMWLDDDDADTVILPTGERPLFIDPMPRKVTTEFVIHGIKDDPAPTGYASAAVTFTEARAACYPMAQLLEIGNREAQERGRRAGEAAIAQMQQRRESAGGFWLIPAANT
jgi:hypothetical protein